jgi:hypothetical protein
VSEFVSLSSWRTTQLTTHSPTSQPQDNPEMRSSAVHTPLLDDSVANAAQAEALRLEGNDLFKVGWCTALFHVQARAFFISGSAQASRLSRASSLAWLSPHAAFLCVLSVATTAVMSADRSKSKAVLLCQHQAVQRG